MTLVDDQKGVRSRLLENLRQDLLGPTDEKESWIEDKRANEGDSPANRYLLGVLHPEDAEIDAEEDDFREESTTDDTDEIEVAPTLVGVPKPSSIGLSFGVEAGTSHLTASFRYGLYSAKSSSKDGSAKADHEKSDSRRVLWSRTQISQDVPLKVVSGPKIVVKMPGGGEVEWFSREGKDETIVTVFLRNRNKSGGEFEVSPHCIFQPEISVRGTDASSHPFVSHPRLSIGAREDPDLESYRLLYRDRHEFAVGHGCAAAWDEQGCPAGRARSVRSELVPSHEVRVTEARGGLGLPGLDMDLLSRQTATNGLSGLLSPLADAYGSWIGERKKEIGELPEDLRVRAHAHILDCEEALWRIRRGIALLESDTLVRRAFHFANKAMKLQRVQTLAANHFKRTGSRVGVPSEKPRWHPFQLAFILMNLEGVSDSSSPDRELADLLWFPTGGGKTEAYLGLAAFVIGLRRLRAVKHPREDATGDGGVTVIMRYTLRLLTIQQFQRAATLICACEKLRVEGQGELGRIPFSIGLWVGGSTTPNYIDSDPDSKAGPGATQVLAQFDPDHEPSDSNPVQLRGCPWCGSPLSYRDYTAIPELSHLRIRCPNASCDFHGDEGNPRSGIPAYLVDEDLYLRCPTLVIATADKFARLPWEDRTKALFGRVDRRCARHDFLASDVTYRNCTGRHIEKGSFPATPAAKPVPRFLPPELIIQDELHLITGPLGSLMGVYEGAVDYLCTIDGRRPKVIASTATIRRARDQIRGLFDRYARQFPPPGLIAGDSFFAAEVTNRPGRLYVGVCAPGRSVKTAAIRLLSSLFHSSDRERLLHSKDLTVVDPYWTLIYYFNSLRELGGALRFVDDDVQQRIQYLAGQDKTGPPRAVDDRPELTSRIPSKDIPQLLKRMEASLESGESLDAVLCTNMLSVGVDVQRLGLMVVNGQPKTSSEYIQATSRVGRTPPGLIVTLFNWSRPRDLSHYERFVPYHSMMYRHVEASSLTPYASRARDRAIHAVVVALLRLTDSRLSGNGGAAGFDSTDPLVAQIISSILDRIQRIDPAEVADSRDQLRAFVDGWAEQRDRSGSGFTYGVAVYGRGEPENALLQSAEEGLGPGFPKGTLNSLRDVEQTSDLYYKPIGMTSVTERRK